tara:strand:- start:30 stop:305 length:276 start_codon:yes stop_codon:yes gene_type:complete
VNDPNPLSFCTIEELWEELASRTETAIMAYVINKDDTKDTVGHFAEGNITNCMGLTRFLTNVLEDQAMMGLYLGEDLEGDDERLEDDLGDR